MTKEITAFAMNQLSKRIMNIADEIDEQLDNGSNQRHYIWQYVPERANSHFFFQTEKQKTESKDWRKIQGRAIILDELVELANEIEEYFNVEREES